MKTLITLLLCLTVSQAYGEIQVKDYLGRDVRLASPAQRIVALAPHIVENLYSAGAGKQIAGAVSYSDYPEAAKEIPRVGSYSSFSLEAILALKPDLVIIWYSGRGGRHLEKLEKLGIPTYASNPGSLGDIARSIRDFGILSGNAEYANKVANTYDEKLNALTTQYAKKTKVSTLYQVWNDPIQTLNDEHIISDVIRICGGINAFGDSVSLAPKISVESVIARNPDVIIASGMSESRPDWLDMWKKWTGISAVSNKNLYFVPPDIIQRHTVRILDGSALMCEHIDKARRGI